MNQIIVNEFGGSEKLILHDRFKRRSRSTPTNGKQENNR